MSGLKVFSDESVLKSWGSLYVNVSHSYQDGGEKSSRNIAGGSHVALSCTQVLQYEAPRASLAFEGWVSSFTRVDMGCGLL